MSTTIRFGRIAGIPVGANWTLLVVAALVTSGLKDGFAGAGTSLSWVAAVSVTVAFYAGLVAHELGHALVARHYGVRTREITLWLLGGVAKLDGDTPDAKAEGLVAVAGPAVSAALAAGWLGVAETAQALGAHPVAVDVAATLAVLNLIIAVFNLVPAFPMDGGRVLRAVVWAAKKNRLAGTRAAGATGKVVGAGIVGFGVWMLASTGRPTALLTSLIGMFVIAAGTQEVSHVHNQESLRRLTAGAAAGALPGRVDPTVTIAQMDLDGQHGRPVSAANASYLVGMSAGQVSGIVTYELLCHLRDVGVPVNTPVGEVAFPWERVPTVDAKSPVTDASAALASASIDRVRVQEGGRDVGMLSAYDLMKGLIHAEA